MMKNVCILTEEGRGYPDEVLLRAVKDIRETFQETDSLNFLMGPDLNDAGKLIQFLKDENTGYLLTSLTNMGYFHPASEFPILIELFETHKSENPWSVLAPIIERGLAEQGAAEEWNDSDGSESMVEDGEETDSFSGFDAFDLSDLLDDVSDA